MTVKCSELRQIEPAMQCCYVRNGQVSQQWEMQIIRMKMNDIKISCELRNLIKHHALIHQPFLLRHIKALASADCGNKLSFRNRITRCE